MYSLIEFCIHGHDVEGRYPIRCLALRALGHVRQRFAMLRLPTPMRQHGSSICAQVLVRLRQLGPSPIHLRSAPTVRERAQQPSRHLELANSPRHSLLHRALHTLYDIPRATAAPPTSTNTPATPLSPHPELPFTLPLPPPCGCTSPSLVAQPAHPLQPARSALWPRASTWRYHAITRI